MDCNSYSYAPTMLDCEKNYLARFENDDMYIELENFHGSFTVYAFSYDGDLDVYEMFSDENQARILYQFILDNYTYSPPGPELEEFIFQMKQAGQE